MSVLKCQTRRTALLCLGLMSMGVSAVAQERRLRGTIVNRDGVPQRGCRVEFFRSRNDAQAIFETFTDDGGNFYLNNPPVGYYQVKVSLGARSGWTGVARIDAYTIEPSRLVVDW